MKIRRRPRTPQTSRRLQRARRYAAVACATLLVLLTLLYVAARVYWPMVATRQVDLEALLTRTTKHSVRLGRIEPYWDGFNPGVRVWGATVYGEDGRTPSVRIAEVQGSLALLPLLWGRVEVGRLVLSRPALTLVRQDDGRIVVAGLATPAQGTTGGGFAWLLQQPRVVVQNGEVRWLDARDPGGPLLLSQVELTLRNSGERHRLTAAASFPQAMCRECSMSLDIKGNPLAGPWSGEIAVRAQGLNVSNLPLIARERLPSGMRGQFSVQLWSDWSEGQPQMVRGDAAVTGLRVPLSGERRPLTVLQLSTHVGWRAREENGWRLDLADLKLTLARRSWSAGRLRFAKSDNEISFDVQRLELDDLTAFVANYQSEHPWLKRWVDMQPTGTLEHVDVRLRGPYSAPEAFAVKARLVNVGLTAHERVPGVRGVSGRLSLDADGGEFALDATDFALHLPNVFRAPLDARQASGQVRWEKRDTGWHIIGDDLRVRGDDGSGTGSLTLDLSRDPAVSPVLKTRIDFRDGNGANAARYFPAQRLPPRLLDWMESAFMGGRVVSGHMIYQGPTRAWPFEAGQGRFEIRATVRNGVYRYLRGWTPLTQVEADVAVDGANVRVSGQGRIGNLSARNVRVELRRAEGGDGRVVHVQGQVDGPLPETLRVLREVDSPRAASWQPYVAAVAQSGGTGTIDLTMQVPIRRENQREPSFLVAYRFKDAALKLENGTGLDAANGSVRFSEAGLREGEVQGQLFGGPLTLAARQEQGELRVEGNGRVLLPVLLQSRPALAERVSGGIGWSLSWQDRAGGPQLQAEADLRAVRMRLPPPLFKTEAGPFEKLTLATEQSRANSFVVALAGGVALNGKIAFARTEGKWSFQKGRVEIGKGVGRLPTANGLEVAFAADTLDVDRWLPLFGSAGTATTARLPFPVALTADVKQLNLANRRWGRVFLHLVQRNEEWRAVVDGDAVAGEGMLVLAPKAPPRIRLDLAFLRLPERVDDKVQDMDATDPRRLPTLDLHALSFEYKQRKFGELNFSAVSYAQGWRVDRMDLQRGEMSLKTRGVWRVSGERQLTDLNIEFDSDNMGATLDAFGASGQMAGGKVRVRSDLSWPGSPLRPSLAGLNGKVEVSAEKGRFLKVDPGAARLFGLLDLRSIGRYLTLDFTPAFGKGYVFDAIHGNIALEHGNAYTSNLIVKGPSLALGVNGRVGLASEDYDLVLEASPQFGSTLTLTSLGIFGPQAAAAVLALQRLFRRQIEAGTRITYLVKGPWDSPRVTKLGKPANNDGAPPEAQ
jgi:uncharacterized protein (TIGR02099 family)